MFEKKKVKMNNERVWGENKNVSKWQ